jgi:uncharacterized protein
MGSRVIRLHRWRGVVQVALFLGSCAIVLATVGPLMPRLPGQWSQVALGTATSLAAYAITVLFVRWDRVQLKDVGAAVASRSSLLLAIGFLIGLILVGLQSLIVGLVGHVRWIRAGEVEFTAAGVPLLAYLVLSCREELAFHGYPLRRLDWFFGPYIAQLLVAIVFALEHVVGGYSWTNAFLGAAVGSLLFGMASLATKGLAVPIGLHAAWNFGSWVLGGKETSGLWNLVIEQDFRDRVELVQMISYLVVVTLATFAFWWLYRRRMSVDQLMISEHPPDE